MTALPGAVAIVPHSEGSGAGRLPIVLLVVGIVRTPEKDPRADLSVHRMARISARPERLPTRETPIRVVRSDPDPIPIEWLRLVEVPGRTGVDNPVGDVLDDLGVCTGRCVRKLMPYRYMLRGRIRRPWDLLARTRMYVDRWLCVRHGVPPCPLHRQVSRRRDTVECVVAGSLKDADHTILECAILGLLGL